MAAPTRALLGFVAAAVAVLTFHQAMWAALYAAGMMPRAPFPTNPTGPLGVPTIANLCFWGGLYGAAFGLALPRLPARAWIATVVSGLLLGYSSRLAFGCNVGALFSGISTGSLHGWAWLVLGFAGSVLGVRLRTALWMEGRP